MVKKYAKIWWEGFKIFCGWSLFEIILLPLWLPAMALHNFFGEVTGSIIGFVLAIPIVPIIFFLTFKFLLLFIDQEQNNAESDGDSTGIEA